MGKQEMNGKNTSLHPYAIYYKYLVTSGFEYLVGE